MVVLIWRELDVFAVGKLVNLVGACEHISPFVVHLVKERERRRERSESRRTARRMRLITLKIGHAHSAKTLSGM